MFMLKKDDRSCNSGSASAESSRTKGNIRIYILQLILGILFSFLLYHLWKLQIVNGEKYAEDYELKVTRTVKENNLRGMIYDRNGEILAYNEPVYSVTMTDEGVYSSNRERQLALNSMIYHVVKKLEENNEQLNNELKINLGPDGNFEYTVTGKSLARFKADIFGKANADDMTPEQKNMSANDMLQFLSSDKKFALYGEGKSSYSEEELQKYNLPKEYSGREILSIVGIRYMLSLNAYKKYVPVILARDISEETAVYIFENSHLFKGIDVGEDWKRVYTGGEAFSHILGYTGKISSEDLERNSGSGKNYTIDSVVGKAGIELYLEEQLQGSDGERQIMVNNVGNIVGEDKIIKETVNGKDVYLSVDKNLQIAVYDILERNLAEIIAENLINTKEFDKNNISDTTDIRIPVYDVYLALVDNGVIRTEDLRRMDATELEKETAAALESKYREVIEALKTELWEGTVVYDRLTVELQEYIAYTVDELEILNRNSIDKEDDIYKKWIDKRGISGKEFLTHAVECGWVNAGFIQSEQSYITADEMYFLLLEAIERKLSFDGEFEKLLFKWLILREEISGRNLCRLLYDQKILDNADGDYEKLVSGEMDVFSFLKKKILQLEITPAQLALDPCSASAVVVEPETGKVRALVSYPGYDNNRLANQMDSVYYNRLLKDKSLPLYNRATQQLTAPGSTFKPVTIIAGIQEGVISSNSSIFCDGVFDAVVPPLKCWKHSGHGNVTNVSTALQFSCNDYMCEIVYRIGANGGMDYTDKTALNCLQEYSKLFYLDKKSGVEITESEPHVTDAYGIPSSIGQGTHNYATVQLARYVSIIASKGSVFPLTLVKGISDTDGVIMEKEAVLDDRVELPDSIWNSVHLGMQQFARNDSAFKNMKTDVAGKTGTAQESKTRPDHALFVGFAPAAQPEIALAVRIANGYGSSNVTAIAKNIFNYYFGLEE
ncbi:MAG: peptidase [Lachnospiraceae bacterium]|nr:peptidase [Lachnospiraceae bacterium]